MLLYLLLFKINMINLNAALDYLLRLICHFKSLFLVDRQQCCTSNQYKNAQIAHAPVPVAKNASTKMVNIAH